MGASLSRQLARAEAERDDAIEFAASLEECDQLYRKVREELEIGKDRILRLEALVSDERLLRVSAQRGLVAYMQEHGIADRIGYDPDRDPEVEAAIDRGEIPPRNDPRVIKGVAAAMIAERTT